MRIVLHGLVGWMTFPSVTEELHPGFIAGWNVCAKNALNQILWIRNTFRSARVLGNIVMVITAGHLKIIKDKDFGLHLSLNTILLIAITITSINVNAFIHLFSVDLVCHMALH